MNKLIRKAGGLFREIILFKEIILILVLIVVGITMSIVSPYFFTRLNIEAIFVGLSVEGIIVIGMAILLISGGFDLSVGSTLAFTGVVTGLSLAAGIPVIFSILLGLLAAVSIGIINGMLIAKLNLNPLITTLGMMMAVRGFTLILSKGRAVLNLPESFKVIGRGTLFGVQYPVYLLIGLVIVGDILLRNIRFFRQSYYVGGNELAAKMNGINVVRVKIFNYCLVAMLAGLAGILITARFGSASVTVGQGMELKIIAAAIIGGSSLKGGVGTVLGAFLGALFMQIISTSLNILGVDIYYQYAVTGIILIIAILADELRERKRVGGGLSSLLKEKSNNSNNIRIKL